MLTLIEPGQPFPHEFPKGAIILVDKPLAWTSFDVVNKMRFHLSRRLGIKRAKIGHAGTLDPLATGLLVICIGEYTKKIESLQDLPKQYTGTLTFGATTPSFDLEKAVDATFPTKHLNDAMVQAAAQTFVGDIGQIPPVFSAVKVDGRRLYKNARTGAEVELPVRQVRIESITVGSLRPVVPTDAVPRMLSTKGAAIMLHPNHPEGLQCDFVVRCGKGTYIRSLAKDLGEALETGGYLSALRRTETGGFSVEKAWTVEDFVAWVEAGR